MKRTLRSLLLLLALVLLLRPSALADLIIEPIGDDFYTSHSAECHYLFRRYVPNGEKGYVVLYRSPISAAQAETVANGAETFSCSYTYTDKEGVLWGGVWDDDLAIRGWVRLDQCSVVPDYISFREAHQDDFIPYDSAYDHALENVTDGLIFWPYPGATEYSFKTDQEYVPNVLSDIGTPNDLCSDFYLDSQGRFWGFITYHVGWRDTWLCISDPSNENLTPDEEALPPSPAPIPAAPNVPPPTDLSWLAIVLVAIVAGSTAILIPFLSRHKRGQSV